LEKIKSKNSYNLELPDKEYVLAKLIKFMSAEEALETWDRICKSNNISKNTESIEDLDIIFSAMSIEPGILTVIGNSLKIRMRSYKLLTSKAS